MNKTFFLLTGSTGNGRTGSTYRVLNLKKFKLLDGGLRNDLLDGRAGIRVLKFKTVA
jgi:hypothetical protein